MAKKSTNATTDYVDSALDSRLEPITEQIRELQEAISGANIQKDEAPADASPTPIAEIYQRNENPDLEVEPSEENPYGLMDDVDYLCQVFPDLPRWLTKTPDEHLQMVTDRYRDQAIGTLMVHETRRELKTFLNSLQSVLDSYVDKRVKAREEAIDRRQAQLEQLQKQIAEDSKIVLETAENLDAYYRHAVQLETLKPRRSGLFFMGRHYLPFWFVLLTAAALLACAYLATTFTLNHLL